MSRGGGVYFCKVASLLVLVCLSHLWMDFKNSFTVELTGVGKVSVGVYFCEVASLLVVVYLGHLRMDFKNSFTVELKGAGVSGGVMRGEVA